MQNILKYTLLLLLAFCFSACEDYLSELPTKKINQPIRSLDQLEALLNTPILFETNDAAIYASDDYEINLDFYDNVGMLFPTGNLNYYTFNIAGIEGATSDWTWQEQYGYIYNANLIIENVDKLSGDPTLKARIKADAYFLRAYSNWVLVNAYCLPYCAANLQEPGLSKRNSTDMEASIERMSLEDTYAFIEDDIMEALKIDIDAPKYTWRASKVAINAFLSRLYMYKGEYDKAVEAANYAIAHKGAAELYDYNTLTGFDDDGISYCETYFYTDPQLLTWPETFYARTIVGNGWFGVSQNLENCYDQTNDMRYKYFFSNTQYKNYTTVVPAHNYVSFYYAAVVLSGPSLPEVMLNKAECLLRKATPDIAGALAEVNALRDKRMDPATPDIHLTAATKDEALTKVLQERRRELPFAYRWNDIRRFAVNETTSDDVAISHTFYKINAGTVDKSTPQTYTLPVGSRKYAMPLNGIEIGSSKGQLKQNTY